mmetsp:Transcript_38284/g.92619  ORF Transcript_38284/g.92619 Transcript_38284/m.92619 type:complete len:87 (-) Transcript_38284:40-300(-)
MMNSLTEKKRLKMIPSGSVHFRKISELYGHCRTIGNHEHNGKIKPTGETSPLSPFSLHFCIKIKGSTQRNHGHGDRVTINQSKNKG